MVRFASPLIAALVLLAACGAEDDASIDAVRDAAAPVPSMTNGELADRLAGEPGTVTWQADRRNPPGGDGPDVVQVTATIEKATLDGRRVIVLRYLHYPAEQRVEWDGISIDGRRVSLLRGTREVMRLMLQ